jgi:hypothetical protein
MHCERFASDVQSVRQHSRSDTAETLGGQGKPERPPVASEEEGFPNLTPPKPAKLPQRVTFFALQEWEGYVTSISRSHFTANLVNLTSGAVRADEEATIPLEELSEQDLRNLKVGSVFRWAVGYQYQPAGTKARISQIVIRQLPQWTRRELDEARREAKEMAKFLAGPNPSEE